MSLNKQDVKKREIIKTYSHLNYWHREDYNLKEFKLSSFLSSLKLCDKQPFINSSFPTSRLEGDFFINSNLNLRDDKNGYF